MRHVRNPPNPYNKFSAEYVGEPPPTKLEVFEETATKNVITKAFASDWEGGWRYTVNCYRGCVHGCTYCFARQYHEYLGYGAGTDFETKIVVKPNTPQLLREELKKTRDKMPHLDFSFATDPYLPLEAEYQLTRKCLEVCAEFGVPTAVITKSPLVTRDIDVLKKQSKVSVFFSLPFLTKEMSNPFEPYTPVPEARFRAMKMIADAGIPVGIGVAPVIPGYNESDIPGLLERAKEAGATRAFMSMLHLDTDSIEDYFVEKLYERIPTKAAKVINTLKRERGGTLRHSSYRERMTGETEQWEVTMKLFDFHAKRLGFRQHEKPGEPEIAPVPIQQTLF
ncbi:MAG: radical SAM protein [Blastocatellia bacterium]|nr:radical SAM protein [Blastocatellia bacterium]